MTDHAAELLSVTGFITDATEKRIVVQAVDYIEGLEAQVAQKDAMIAALVEAMNILCPKDAPCNCAYIAGCGKCKWCKARDVLRNAAALAESRTG